MACFRNMVEGSLNIKEVDGKCILIFIGFGDGMNKVDDSVNCHSVFSSSHLFIIEEIRCFC